MQINIERFYDGLTSMKINRSKIDQNKNGVKPIITEFKCMVFSIIVLSIF